MKTSTVSTTIAFCIKTEKFCTAFAAERKHSAMFKLFNKKYLGLVVLGVTWLAFFSRTLFLRQVYFLDDLKIIFYPLEHSYAFFQHHWQLPQWDPTFGFGQPLLGWGQLGFFT